jgi:4-alpha-glucanotransferase
MSENDRPPVLLAFGLHAHQPVGNFDHVFQEHLRDVYRPFLERAVEEDFLPVTLHLSGPLLDWMKTKSPDYLDLVGRLAADGKLELLLAGYYEPILPSLCREDRVEQVRWMMDAIRDLFGIEARGLWLTERVWEPDLAADLAEAGAEYVLVDDRHFVAAGFPRELLHRPFRTESCGKSLGVFAIDEKLRYLIPFHPPQDTATYLRELRAADRYLAVAADDIEKFGGWPGTLDWVYHRGWLQEFMRAMKEMERNGEVRIATFSQALATLPSGGPAYLPSASYREMEEWALPTQAFHRLTEVKAAVGEEYFTRGDSPLIRGSHWRNFLVKYPEANRMHKKMLALSTLCRERGNPPEARHALGRAQCNDAYWHGVFGGLYLRHLRDTVWRNLSEAEGRLRSGEDLEWERRDLDLDGNDELWVHSGSFSALVSPSRGGALEEFTLFRHGVNLANTLTRRREPYHALRERAGDENGYQAGTDGAGEGEGYGHAGDGERPGHSGDGGASSHEAAADTGGTPSIHDLEEGLRFSELPPVDPDERALFVDRILAADLRLEDYRNGRFQPLHSWATVEMKLVGAEEGVTPDETDSSGNPARWVEVCLGDEGPGNLEKRIRFTADGSLDVSYQWNPEAFSPDALFATELSLGEAAEVRAVPETVAWRFPISTFSKSERGFDETVQGESVTIRWPVTQGWGRIRVRRT